MESVEILTKGDIPCEEMAEPSCADDHDADALMDEVQALARDHQLFKKLIDTVNLLGVAGERRNIGTTAMIMNSSKLIPLQSGSESLSGSCISEKGSGKSTALDGVLKLFHEDSYILLSTATAKSFYNLGKTTKHRRIIFVEGFKVNNENEQTLIFRLAISGDRVTYQKSVYVNGTYETQTFTMEGPISIFFTKADSKIEGQLADRLIKTQADASSQQTSRIMGMQALIAAGLVGSVSETDIEIWKTHHDLLEPAQVVIPFASNLLSFLDSQSFPLAARRGFSRVLSSIKTITLMYQAQRERDDKGRLISTVADYFMAYQLINKPFIESIRGAEHFSDRYLQLVQAAGKISLSGLAKAAGVTSPAISQWYPAKIQEGKLAWCDAQQRPFSSTDALDKARSSKKAFICIPNRTGLPTAYELTNDPRWAQGGELFELYDLELDEVKHLRPFGESDGFQPFTETAFEDSPVQ